MSKSPRRFIAGLLAIVLMLTVNVTNGYVLAAENTEPADSITIENDSLSVRLDRQFPRVIEYQWKNNGQILYGQDELLTQVKINGVLYKPEVSYEQEADKVSYHLDFSKTQLSTVAIEMSFKLNENVLEMNVTDIIDPGKAVQYLEFPNHGLISVRSTQSGAALAYNANFANGDKFSKVADKTVDNAPIKVGHVILNTDSLAASIESDMTSQYNYIQTKQKAGYKETSAWSIDFMYRGPDKSVTQLPWVKIAITDDANGDGKVTWQDGALAYREIMDPLIGENLAQKTIAVNILLNYWGRQSWTWENGLDHVKRQALATDNFPQIMLVKGSHRQYGDGWPSYADNNPLMGGNDQFRWLIEEAEKYNVMVGTHTNSVEAYPESPYYETTPKYNGGVWDLVDRGGTAVDAIEYWSSGLLDQRYEAHKNEFQKMKFQYLDVSSGRWDGKEARWTTFKTLQKFKEMGWTYFTEMYLGYVNYTLNSEANNALSPKYMSWVHTYFYGGESNGGNYGNSDIRRFIINDQAIYEAGSKAYQNVLGPGYQKSYGYLGWSEAQTTVKGAVKEFWQHTLADTYLKNFQVLSINNDANNNNYLTAKFKDGVKSVFDGSKRHITKDGILYASLNDNHQEIFIPWDAKTEEKIYTYKTDSGAKTWELPHSWNNVTSVNLYKLDETNGKTLVNTINVNDGKVTILYEAAQGYVITKEKVEQAPIVWGDGSIIKDGNFNSNSLNYWNASNESNITIGDDQKNGNYYLNIAGVDQAVQEINQLEAGESYVISTLVRHGGNRRGALEVEVGDQIIASQSLGYNTKTVMDNVFNGWEQLKVYFTAKDEKAIVRLKGLTGQGNIMFDDVRIYKEVNPYGANGHYYYENFETTHSLGSFVHENSSLARLAYANNGVNNRTQVNGDISIMLGGRNDSKIKTLPGIMKLKPNTGYDLSFTYKSSYGPSNGWGYSIYSESAGKKLINRYLSSYDGQSVTEKISFKTDGAEDYVLVIENKFAKNANKADLALDDLTLDLNPNVVANPPLQPDNFFEEEHTFVEAEGAEVIGSAVVIEDEAASELHGVSSFTEGDRLVFKYMSGGHKLNVKYKNDANHAQSMDLIINGQKVNTVSFESTDGNYATKQLDIVIPNAATIELIAVQAEALTIDLLSINPLYEAEKAEKSGNTGEISDPGASGGKLVWINDANKNNSGLTFKIKSDATDLIIRYTNEKAANRLLDLYVNGKLVKEKVEFPYTGPITAGRYVYRDMTIKLTLAKGDSLQLKAPVGESHVAMMDYISTRLDQSVYVQNITLNKTEMTFNGEANERLIATVTPQDAINASLVWTTDNPSVAEVDNGWVRPVGIGTAIIKAATTDGKKSASSKVIVNALPLTYKVEAESGTPTNSGTAGTTNGAAGEKFVWMNSVNWQTGKIEEASWTYQIEHDGDSLLLRYANQLARDRYLDIYVNGVKVIEKEVFPQTGSQIVGKDKGIPLALAKGDILKLMAPMGETNVAMIDYFMIVKSHVVVEPGDATKLNEAIEAANQLLVNHPEGSNAGQASEEARTALQAAIAEAQEIANDASNQTQVQLDAATTALQAAIADFKDAVVKEVVEPGEPGDATNLNEAIEAANQLLVDHPEGNNAGQASEEARTALLASIAEAQEKANDASNQTQAQLDAATTALQAAIADFKDAVVKEVVEPGDATNLNEAIEAANQLLVDHLEGSNAGQASKEARTALLASIAEAQEIANDASNQTQAQLDAATTALQAAITVFKGNVVKASGGDFIYIPHPHPENPQNKIELLVNGKAQKVGTETVITRNSKQVTTITVDSKEIENLLAEVNNRAMITIPFVKETDVAIGELNGQLIKNMAQKQMFVQLETVNAIYTIPAQQINIESIAQQFGQTVQLQDIHVRIEISSAAEEALKTIQRLAEGEFSIAIPPLNFTVTAAYGDTIFEISKFNSYVERMIAVPDGVDLNKITTGVIIDPEGTVRHVPSKVIVNNGKPYVSISSLTNSTYAVIGNPLEFKDVSEHWAKEAVNDLGSRMILNGSGNGMFKPDQDITRAEFAAIVIRGLGLKPENGNVPFTDVKSTDWYSSAIKTAHMYGLIDGFEDGSFRPMDKITREQAMVIIAKAMKITGLTANIPHNNANEGLNSFTDASDVSSWAKNAIIDCLQAGVITGKVNMQLAPQAYINRAEVAVIVQRLLHSSELI